MGKRRSRRSGKRHDDRPDEAQENIDASVKYPVVRIFEYMSFEAARSKFGSVADMMINGGGTVDEIEVLIMIDDCLLTVALYRVQCAVLDYM